MERKTILLSLQHEGLIKKKKKKMEATPRPAPGQSSSRSPPAGGVALRGSVDCGHLVEAVLLGFEPQVGDAVGHVHPLGRVGVGAGGRVGCHGAEGREERVTSAACGGGLRLSVSSSCGNMPHRSCDLQRNQMQSF